PRGERVSKLRSPKRGHEPVKILFGERFRLPRERGAKPIVTNDIRIDRNHRRLPSTFQAWISFKVTGRLNLRLISRASAINFFTSTGGASLVTACKVAITSLFRLR